MMYVCTYPSRSGMPLIDMHMHSRLAASEMHRLLARPTIPLYFHSVYTKHMRLGTSICMASKDILTNEMRLLKSHPDCIYFHVGGWCHCSFIAL